MKLFNNAKPIVIIILVVLCAFTGYKAFATEIEGGATFASEFNDGYSLSIVERVADGKIDLGLTLISEQDYKGETLPNNGTFWASFVAERPAHWHRALPSEVSIGAAHWIETSRFIGCRTGYQLGIKYRIRDFSVGIRHWSNAGICKPNRGQDLITFGWRFQ